MRRYQIIHILHAVHFMNKNILLWVLCCLFSPLLAQQLSPPLITLPNGMQRKAGELLLQIGGDETVGNVLASLRRRFPAAQCALAPVEPYTEGWHIYKIVFREEQVADPNVLLASVRALPGVIGAQWNRRAAERERIPNDAEFSQQQSLRLIGAPTAWEAGTGGVTPKGDTIVVGVLELGLNRRHPDLISNMWVNRNEIPNNKVDDDRNGYVDDYLGWDARLQGDGNGTGSQHGTAVCGIIGASGNNSIGVTGVNWNVKLMVVTNTEYEEEIVRAYYYMASWRRRYNASKGKEGAFVVATNASLGIDKGLAKDFPLWCAVYDSLGQLGVLNVGATTNQGVDVDVVGDMPSSCGSEFLMVTTNVNTLTDTKVSRSGYGAKSVDMGAPGDGSYTTINAFTVGGRAYGSFSSTSASAPHLSGSIALLYSFGCDILGGDALTDPMRTARRVRDLLFRNTTPLPSLQGVTSTGGRLDLVKTTEAVRNLCKGADKGPLSILDLQPNPANDYVEMRLQTPTFEEAYPVRAFNDLGQLVYQTTVTPVAFELTIHRIDVSQWPSGIYLVVVGQGKVLSAKKFLKN